MPAGNKERHRTGRIGWLRAAVLGANDGICSVSRNGDLYPERGPSQ
jgi:VIT1/CCC1 family predicted Fe2+/Mn2+ transporter